MIINLSWDFSHLFYPSHDCLGHSFIHSFFVDSHLNFLIRMPIDVVFHLFIHIIFPTWNFLPSSPLLAQIIDTLNTMHQRKIDRKHLKRNTPSRLWPNVTLGEQGLDLVLLQSSIPIPELCSFWWNIIRLKQNNWAYQNLPIDPNYPLKVVANFLNLV